MKNIIILGSGRSGTSLAAGILSNSGYYMGDDLIPSREANPKGFFEDREINRINELLLEPLSPKSPPFIGKYLFKKRLRYPHRWLARIQADSKVKASTELSALIENYCGKSLFSYKDPRFTYTLSAWKPYLKNTVFICVFRNPISTANSILKEINDLKSLNYLDMDFDEAIEVWKCMYSYILENYELNENWLFLHFDQLLTSEGLDKIEQITGAKVNRNFPDKKLKRSSTEGILSSDVKLVYSRLCNLAGHNEK